MLAGQSIDEIVRNITIIDQMKTSSKRSFHQELHDAKRSKSSKRNKEKEGQLKIRSPKSVKYSEPPKLATGCGRTPIYDDQDYDNYSDQSLSNLNEIENFSPYSTLLTSIYGSNKQRKFDSRRKISKTKVTNESWYAQLSPEGSIRNNDVKSDIINDSGEEGTDNEDASISLDPYNWHFVSGSPNIVSRLAAVKSDSWISVEPFDESNLCMRVAVPKTSNAESSFRGARTLPSDLWLKHRLFQKYEETKPPLDPFQLKLLKYLLTYHDISYGRRSTSSSYSLRYISCLHALNHVFKTRDRLLKSSEKLARVKNGQDLELRDQGFTRPKVLFLLETRQNCFKYASILSSLANPEQEEHKQRLINDFYLPENKFSKNDPEDFRELFEGNDDNNFKLGVKLTRKTIKYFANFYSADIIFASPLGLRSAIENKG